MSGGAGARSRATLGWRVQKMKLLSRTDGGGLGLQLRLGLWLAIGLGLRLGLGLGPLLRRGSDNSGQGMSHGVSSGDKVRQPSTPDTD